MYIAVIADNIASRKHMERLLDRTSDAIMATTGNLYIEAYGDPESMWPLIKRYDLFFVDITRDDTLREKVTNHLKELGLNSQTVICQEADAAFSTIPAEQGFLSMQHPLSVSALSETIQKVHEMLQHNLEAKKIVEFRSEDTTHYIEANEILYAMEKKHLVEVCLLDGSVREMLGNLSDFYRCVEAHGEFSMYNHEIIINNNHVKKIKGRNITLFNNQTIKLSLFKNFSNPFS